MTKYGLPTTPEELTVWFLEPYTDLTEYYSHISYWVDVTEVAKSELMPYVSMIITEYSTNILLCNCQILRFDSFGHLYGTDTAYKSTIVSSVRKFLIPENIKDLHDS